VSCAELVNELISLEFYPCLDMLGDLAGDVLMSLPLVEFPSISGILIHCLKVFSAATSFPDDVDAVCRC
jgi:hypothetical protein